jgi:type IV secretory pathway component VirB8
MSFRRADNQNDVSEEALKERSYLWMARVFGLICMVTFIANLILYSALDSLMPLVRVQPFFITTQDKDQQVIQIARPSPAQLSSKQLQESFVRQYLVARMGIGSDTDELKRRWGTDGTVQWMSSDSVFTTFLRDYATGLMKLADEEGLTRDVEILNVSEIPRQKEILWRAEVRLIDRSRSAPEPQITEWTVDMRIVFGFLRHGLTWEKRLKNPLGFAVDGYAQRILNTTAKGDSI